MGQLRTGMGGVTGLDLSAVLAVAQALDYDTAVMVELLQFGEAGLLAGLKKQERGEAD